MGRTQRALTSLIAAIPAGVLTYLLVMVFLNRADTLNTMSKVAAGLTLACSFLVTAMPILLLVLGGRKAKGAADEGNLAASSGEADVIEEADEVAEASDAEVSAEVGESDAELEETSDFEIEEGSDADIMSDSSGEFDAGPASSLDEIESVDFEDEEEEPKPKKRKK